MTLKCKLCDYVTPLEFSPRAQKHEENMERRLHISLKTKLSIHIKLEHKISIQDYIVLTEYNGISPKCACGLCNEPPIFSRWKFSEYALGHDRFEYRETKYLEMHGAPHCLNCGIECDFYRGQPKTYCSASCSIKHQNIGFCDPDTQITIRNNVLQKYGVENIAQIQEVRTKISQNKKDKYYPPKNPEQTKIKQSQASKKKWQDPEYKERTTKSLRIACNQPKEIKRRREFAKEAMKNPERLDAFIKSVCTKFSKLHINTRDKLELEKLGFISEQKILRYLVDELNEEKKIAIEINGDYVHANPKLFSANDIIRMPGNSYTAEEKWQSDALKIKNIEDLGYKVFVIWESDNLEEKRKELYQLIGI